MTTNRSRAGVRSARWAGSGPGRWLRPGLTLLGLLVVGLSQVGCQSNGCSTCGLGSRLKSNVQALNARLFNHEGRGCSTCGAFGTEGATVVDSGVPITGGEVVVPGAIATPGAVTLPAPGTIVPAPSTEATPELVPIPSTATGPHAAPVTSRQLPVSARTGNLVADRTRRGSASARVAAPDAATRAGYSTDEPNLLDQLPPVALPAELTRKANPAGSASTSDPIGAPQLPPPTTGAAIPGAGGLPAAAPAAAAANPSPITPAENRSAGASPANLTIQALPGIARSAPVAPTVVGGSLPSDQGLDCLRDKGYRTLVDLRTGGEVDPTFAERVSDRGMLYVALPFASDPIRMDRLTRFNDLLTQSDQRPLYFCDGDGRRAGLLWYLHLRSSDREERTSARSKAEEVGFNAALDQARAEAFLTGNVPALAPVPSAKTTDTKASVAPVPQSDAPAAPLLTLRLDLAPASVSQLLDPDSPSLPVDAPDPFVTVTSVAPTPAPPITAKAPVAPRVVARADSPGAAPVNRDAERSPVPFDRTSSWKPMATLVLSGLGVPLAYWSRTTLFQRRGPRRASLTAKGPGPRRSLPGSGA